MATHRNATSSFNPNNSQPLPGTGFNQGAEPTGQTPGQKTEAAKGMPFSIPSFSGNLFAAPMPLRMGSEQYQKLKEAFLETYKSVSTPDFVIDLLDMDKAAYPDLAFSCLIVAGYYKQATHHGAAYHILMLEGTGKRLENTKETFKEGTTSREFEIQQPTEKAIDNELLTIAKNILMAKYVNMPLRYTSTTVVPEFFTVTDEDRLYQLAVNTALSVNQELITSVPGAPDINLVEQVPKDSRLFIKIAFDKKVVEDIVGNPLRSDVQISFTTSRPKGDRHVSHNSRDREQTVTDVTGFFDLLPAPQQTMGPAGYPGYRTPPYVARFIMTNIASNFFYTPGGVALAMATAFTVNTNEAWVQGFMPTATRPGEIDMSDIGALNIDANLNNEPNMFGTAFSDTKNADFKLLDLGKMMGALTHKALVFSIDCPVAGPQTWYTAILRSLNNNNSEAKAIFLNAINQLTNRNFEKFFPADKPLTVDNGNTVHLGYWFDGARRRRDVREFGLVEVCNLLGRQNPNQIREWLNTFYALSIPEEIRLSNRWNMIQAMSGDTAVCTGTAERVTFNYHTVAAIAQAMADTKVPVTVQTPLSASEFNYQRPAADFLSQAMVSSMPVFTPGYSQSPGVGSYSPNNFRWG